MAEEFFRTAEQLGFGHVHGNQVGLEFLDQFFQRCGDFGNRQNASHIGAALERVQGALQIIADRPRQFLRAIGQEAHQGIQVGFRRVAENLQQLRINQFLVVCAGQGSGHGDRRHWLNRAGSRRLAFGQGMGGSGQQIDIVTLTLGLGGIFFDQGRQQLDHLGDDLLHRFSRFDAAIQHAIEQVFNRPGQLADHQRAHHPTTALEGVEGPAHFAQGLLVGSIGTPLRQVFGDGFQHLAGFLDKHFQQLFVHRLFIGRRRQQAGRHVLGWRVNRLHRCGHYVGHRQGFVCNLCRCLRLVDHDWQLDVRQLQLGQFGLTPVRRGIVQAQLVERQGALGQRQLLHIQAFQRLQAFKAFQRRIETEIQRLIADRQRFAQVPVMLVKQRRRNVSGQLGKRLIEFAIRVSSENIGVLGKQLHRLIGQCQGNLFQRLIRQHLDIRQRIGQWRRRLSNRCRPVENRRFFLQRIAQAFQAFFRHVEDQVALSGMVFRQALEVVLDAGNGIGQGVEVLPVRHGLAHQQLFLDVAVAGLQQVCGAGQGNHRQTATDLSQQLGDAGQVLMIPLRGNEFDDGVFGLLQAGTRLLDHQLVNLRHIGGGQMAFFTAAFVGRTGHARQGRFDVKQRTGDIHQQCIAGLTLAGGQAVHHINLIENDFTRLTEAQHSEGIADLLERRHKAFPLGHLAAVAAHEQVQAVLDPHQLFTECRHHRTHGITIRTGQAGTFLIDHIGIRQRIVQTILFFQHTNARRLGVGLGDIEQQVLGQIIGRRLVDAIGTLLDQTLELFIDLAQQGTHRGAMTHAAIGQAFDHAGSDLPQRAKGRLFAQGFQASKNPRHIA